MVAGKLLLLCGFLSGFCRALPAQETPRPFEALNGMWHIAGTRNPSQYPFLAISFAVQGDMVYGFGDLQVRCLNRDANSGTTLWVAGKVNADGSFVMTSSQVFNDPFVQATIRGAVPSEGSTEWAGSLTLANSSSGRDCVFNYARDFVATAYPSLGGSYAGSIHSPSVGPGLDITLRLAPGEISCNESPGSSGPFCATQMNATIEVSGYRNFTAEAVATRPHSGGVDNLQADGFSVEFPLEDGSRVSVYGFYSDGRGSALHVAYSTWIDGKPAREGGSGVLIRQSMPHSASTACFRKLFCFGMNG
jgi:hypothetical protein